MYAKFYHNSPLSSAIFTFSGFGARHSLDRCQMLFCNLLGQIWQSLCLDHFNSNGYSKFYQNIPKGSRGSRDRTSLTFFRIWTSAKPRPILNTNINVYLKFHYNILYSSRDRAIFHFFRIWSSAKPRPIKNVTLQSLGLDLVSINVYANLALGKASTDDKCHFAIPWARSFQHQIVCKILSKYSKRLKG